MDEHTHGLNVRVHHNDASGAPMLPANGNLRPLHLLIPGGTHDKEKGHSFAS